VFFSYQVLLEELIARLVQTFVCDDSLKMLRNVDYYHSMRLCIDYSNAYVGDLE